jgi:anti-anti-sigma regulatory factor
LWKNINKSATCRLSDSAGLGALIRLKMHSISAGGVSVKFVQITPRILQLLKITNLTEWFSS